MIWNDAAEDKDGILNVKLSFNNLPVDQPASSLAKSSSTKDQELLKKRKRVI